MNGNTEARHERERAPEGRLDAVDAARGTVMLLVFLSHFADAYLYPLGGEAAHLRERLNLLTMMASPGFMLISGVMLGMLHARRRGRFEPMQARLQRRGLFLLTVGHLLIVPTCRFWANEPWYLMRVMPVTDTIGLALLVGPLLVTRLGTRARAALGLALFAVSWALCLGWWPHSMAGQLVKEVLVGQRGLSVLLSTFPMVPWFGVYLMGSVFGEWLGTRGQRDILAVARRFQGVGLWVGALGVVLVGIHVGLKRWVGVDVEQGVAGAVYALTSQSQKYPPGPAYVALYGGTVLLGLGLLMWAERAGRLRLYLRWASVVGRHSLLAFLLQFYVYYVGIYSLHLRYTRLWPLEFAVSVALLWGVLWAWDQRESSARAPAAAASSPAPGA